MYSPTLVVLVRLGILHDVRARTVHRNVCMHKLMYITKMSKLKNQRYLQRLVELEQDEVVVAVPPPRSRLDGEYACIHPCQ